jgi:hypothetical protein
LEAAKRSENSGVEGKILQCLLKEVGLDDMGGIHLAQHREEWQAVGNMLIKFWISPQCGESLK